MGEAIEKSAFEVDDFKEFQQRLETETQLLEQWFKQDYFADGDNLLGFELEGCIIDKNAQPMLLGDQLIKNANHQLVTEELANFNFELNSLPLPTTSSVLSDLKLQLEQTWQICREQAQLLDADIIAIGSLPTLTRENLCLNSISKSARFQALNHQIMKARNDTPIEINIKGKEHYINAFDDIIIESAATSIQIHLQLPPKRAHHYYNASAILSSIMVAVGGNSRYLLGHELWHETRIPIFEQTVASDQFGSHDCKFISRASFGQTYTQASLMELFTSNLASKSILLPCLMDTAPESLAHLRLHNGTIWRWNRPIIGIEHNRRPHLRLEHRVVASGPSITDTVADVALFLGLIEALAKQEVPVESNMLFTVAKNNFYNAARYGLKTNIKWTDGKYYTIQTLILDQLLDLAKKGLRQLQVDEQDIHYYIDEIIKERVTRNRTGSNWQHNYLAKHGCSFQELTLAYLEQQKQDLPIYRWDI